MKSLPLFLLALGSGLPGLAQAQGQQVAETREAVRQIAFDPSRYFPSLYVRDSSIIRISYTGDDYRWPVYSIAVSFGCIDGEKARDHDCGSRLRARMVRAPAAPGLARLRQRGAHLIEQVVRRGAVSPGQISAALDALGPEWLEADLQTCPNAVDVLEQSREAAWAPDEVAAPLSGSREVELVLHADIVRVELQQYARRTTYEGWLADGSPGAWAERLSAVLEPCWRPAAAPTPWHGPIDPPGSIPPAS